MRISDWSSDVCSSDLNLPVERHRHCTARRDKRIHLFHVPAGLRFEQSGRKAQCIPHSHASMAEGSHIAFEQRLCGRVVQIDAVRSEEHTSELQSLMRISYAVFSLKNKNRVKKEAYCNKTIAQRSGRSR